VGLSARCHARSGVSALDRTPDAPSTPTHLYDLRSGRPARCQAPPPWLASALHPSGRARGTLTVSLGKASTSVQRIRLLLVVRGSSEIRRGAFYRSGRESRCPACRAVGGKCAVRSRCASHRQRGLAGAHHARQIARCCSLGGQSRRETWGRASCCFRAAAPPRLVDLDQLTPHQTGQHTFWFPI
jgi:hypothetical protein